jgi:hypothetical protein
LLSIPLVAGTMGDDLTNAMFFNRNIAPLFSESISYQITLFN